MFRVFSKRHVALFIWSQFLIANPLFCATIFVTSTDSFFGTPGSLGAALYEAEDGDVIDCSPIAGQTIGFVGGPLPPIGSNFSLSTASLTILGSGVIIDGGDAVTVFSLALGSASITDFTIQNGRSAGGSGGFGITGGGGGTGGGGAVYIHSGTTLTLSATALNNNQAIGGVGGAGNSSGGSGGGGGGYSGGAGGFASTAGATAGSGGGGGGNSGGTTGGRDGANGSPNTFGNLGGAGGGGERPAPPSGARAGGSVAAGLSIPSHSGGAGGTGTSTNGGGGGGGGGSGGNGAAGTNGTNPPSAGSGKGGVGGIGFGTDSAYGAGGGGGGGNGGGAGQGAGGGGGGLTGSGGAGGTLGGGGGASGIGVILTGGAGGFGAGGGAGYVGGSDLYGLGGAGGSGAGASAGGGGGSGLGGAIFIQGGGLLILEDGVSFSDNSTTGGTGGASTGSSGANGASLGEDIFIRSGGSVTFQINGSLTLSNPIEGGGLLSEVTGPGVILSGTGNVNLNGTNTYLGETLLQSGILSLNGSVLGDVTIESNGTLSGNATVHGSLYNNGILSPGNSIGSVFTTDLYLYSTSVYNVEVNSAGASDEIIASGLAQVSGGVVVTPEDLNFTSSHTYTIISTGTGVTGSFSSLTSSVPALMSLLYNPLNIQLNYLPLNAISLTGNALHAANGFATLPATPGSDVATVNSALLALNFDGIQDAYNQMGPGQFSAVTEIQLLDAILVRSTYTKHLAEFCSDKDWRCGKSMSLWIDGIAEWQNQNKSDSQFGYRDTTLGATIGFDYFIPNFILGLAFSSTYDHCDLQSFSSKANLNSYYGGFYSRWNRDRFYLNVVFLGAYNHYRTTRGLNFGTIDRQAHSKHNGSEWLGNLALGYQVCRDHFQWTPYINLDYVLQHEQSYTESGAGSLDLHVKAKDATLFQGEVGISFNATYSAWGGALVPMVTLAYINQTPCSSKNYEADFVSSTYVFTNRGGNYERNLFAPRLSCTYQGFCNRVNASIYYDGEIGSRYWAQDVGFELSFRF